jgi:lichenan operon transcriptional antiterminator
VNQNYLIDLTDDDFISKFVLHLKNISIRNASGFISKNPLTKTIKYSSPLVYDLSVFIANIIMGREDWALNEDEIAYIALHVGSCIELKKRTTKKVEAVLICPDYYGTHKFIQEEILNQLGNHLHIKHIVTHIDKSLLNLKADIFITTMPISFKLPAKLVTITPFATSDDIKVIQQGIDIIKQRKSMNIIKKDLFSLFDKRLFLKDKAFPNKITIIRYLGERMESLGKVHENFIEDVIKREKMSSTAFNNIVAVPHSLHMNTPSSCISIYIPRTPIKWGISDNVRLVALIAMDKNNRKVYLDIYDQFIKVLSDPANISVLIESKNYEEFIEVLYRLMEKQDTGV